MKSWYDNDITDHIEVISATYFTKLLKSIGQCVVYDKDEIEQRCDRSYKTALH